MGKIMLNGVDYSAPTAGGNGKQPCVVFHGALTSGSTSINMSSYSDYFYDGLRQEVYTRTASYEYTGTINGRYVIIRAIGSIDGRVFSGEICVGIPQNSIETLHCISSTGCILSSTDYVTCASWFESAKHLYPPDTYGNIRTNCGYISFTLAFTGDTYMKTRLTISLVNTNGLVLHRVELL